jgi:gliding motility-associated-like protein
MKSGPLSGPAISLPIKIIGTLFLMAMLVGELAAQNIAPEITGQSPLSTPQDTPLEILFEHLQVTDPDNVYPDDFTMTLEAGSGYTLSGNFVVPDPGFSGTLTVPVTVNDGEASSLPFSLQIDVIAAPPANVPPSITGQSSLTVMQGGALTINFSDLTVDDPDDSYPTGFTMTIQDGDNYSVSGQTITPDPAFSGVLSVPVTVNDGEDESEPFAVSITVTPQEPANVKPTITGQSAINTMEGVGVTIGFDDLTVTDPDDTYPNGFTMTLSAGANYTVNGTTITPDAGFAGNLSVPVTVNDGEDSSDPFNLVVTVTANEPENVKPVITGQVPLSTEEEKAIDIKLDHLTVTDPDDPYPTGFSLSIIDGPNYSVNGSKVKPDKGFTGQLSVQVTVNDGEDSSDPFTLLITVEPKQVPNVKPTIIGQTPLTILNTESLTITFSHLFVTDPDNAYPSGFTLKVYPGSNYTFSGTTVTPPANFTGTLTVKVSVNDGKDESNIFDLKITVNAPVENVKPVITGQQELTTFKNTPIALRLTHLIVSDPDDVYPGTFTMEILPGDNYTRSGNTVNPATGFTGSLSVGVRVNDGTVWSEPFILTITVIEKNELRITGQDEIVVKEDSTFTIGPALLEVNDPSNTYPAGFQVVVNPGAHYTVSGSTIVPEANFSGTLEISVLVKNGSSTSNTFGMVVLVTPVNDAPSLSVFNTNSLVYSPANGDIPISEEVIVEDPDHDHLVYAEVFIDPAVFIPEKDYLTAASTANIRSVFDPNTGIMVLLGVATLDEYQSTLRTVRYIFDNDTLPEIRTRPVHFRLNDGESFSSLYTKAIGIVEVITLDIPNVFSPNDDEANDTWIISRQSQSDNTSVTIRVFDKRGTMVYESHSLDQAWDGKFRGENLPSDTYFYTIEVRSRSNPIRRKGVVTILR